MEFRQLEVFVSVAQENSFSKAADELFLSQSTVSSHIKNLEKELGKPLLVRSTKRVQITEEGQIFLGYAQRILETREAALRELNSPVDAVIHMGASTIPSGYLLPPLLGAFRRDHNFVYFDIRQGDSRQVRERVLDGTVELGVVGCQDGSRKLTSIPLCEDRLVLVLPSNDRYVHLLKEKPDMKRLLEEPIIMREKGSGTQKAADLFLESIHVSSKDLHVVARNNDLESIKRMIMDGMGISVFSEYAIQDLQESGQVLTLPLETDIKRTFYIIYQKDRELRPLTKELVGFLQSAQRSLEGR